MAAAPTRKATLKHAPGIQQLIQHYAARRFLLPRTLDQVCENLRDFHICEDEGKIVGCGALHFWKDLAEIRSLAVTESHWRHGIATAIVQVCIEEAKVLEAKTIFLLTYQPDFFERFGFSEVSKDKFPQKIWVDCAICPQFPNCTETAMIMDVSSSS